MSKEGLLEALKSSEKILEKNVVGSESNKNKTTTVKGVGNACAPIKHKYVVSIDVGIKNLALCVFRVSCCKSPSQCKILHWDVINLCNEEKPRYCDHCKYQAVYQKCVANVESDENIVNSEDESDMYHLSDQDQDCCFSSDSSASSLEEVTSGNNACYEYFCKRHSKSIALTGLPVLPESVEPNVVKKLKYNDLVALCEERNIDYHSNSKKKISKEQILANIRKHCRANYLELVTKTKVNAKDISLIEVGTRLVKAFDQVKHKMNMENTTVLIENQISPLANRMKTIQGMITQYFIMNLVHDVIFVSSINKLKDFVKSSGDYNNRKKMGISICKDIIMTNDNFSDNLILLENSKKKDDMADSFLQGLWYLRKYGYFELDSAIYST